MTRRRSAACLLAAFLLASCASSSPTPERSGGLAATTPRQTGSASAVQEKEATLVVEQPVEAFSKRRAMRHVRKLAGDVGVRLRATRGETRAARYIADKFRSFGYQVKIQKFDVDGGMSRNVVAWWPESRRHGFVIGAHMDTVARSPGANDNASGVAVTLELARLVAGKAPSEWVRFVAFGSEEYGSDGRHHVGSQVFVNRLGERGRNRLGGMTSVDLVADGRPLLVGNSGIADDVVARTVFRRIRDAGIGVRYHTLCDCSDHGPFEHAGIPASFAYSGPDDNYHDESDTVPNMKPQHLMRTGRAMRAFVVAIDRDMIERFRRH